MSGERFFDTDILVHAQQAGRQGRSGAGAVCGRRQAQRSGAQRVRSAVSRRKQRRNWDEIAEAIDDVLTVVDPPLALTHDVHKAARALAEDNRLSFYDALIVASAIEAGCDTLYSEDMQHGRNIGGLTIVNRFLESAL